MGYESGLPASGTLPQREHDKVNDYEGQKRVDIWGFDGANWNRAIVDSSGRLQAAITGGSAGVQYTEGDVDTSITGTAVMWEDAGDTMRPVSAVFPLPVNIVAGSSAGAQFDDGDAIDTDSQGNLLIAATAIPGTARAVRCDDDGALHISDGGNVITVDGTVVTGIEKAEDAAHSSGAIGAFALGVRNDLFATTFTDANGDYTPIGVSASGQLSIVSEKQHNTATGANDFGVQAMGVRNDNAATDLTTGNLRHSEFAVDVKGRVFTNGSTVTQPVSGAVDTELPAAAVLADNTATPTTPLVGVMSFEFDGGTPANWSFVRHSYYKAYVGISGAGAQASVDMTDCPMSKFSVQEFKTGTVSAYNFDLQGSNDGGTTWFLIVNNTSASGADATVFAVDKPARHFRILVNSKTGAGTIDIHVLACGR